MTRDFQTPEGRPVPAVTAEEMREVDRLAVEEFGIDLLQMMENAGRTLARRTHEMVEEGEGSRGGPEVVVVAGDGGNGGGGLACARHLHNRDVSVSVVLDRPAADLTGAAARQHGILEATGVPTAAATDAVPDGTLRDAALVVDALIGYGLSGAVRGTAADLVAATNDAPTPVLSLDVPSGRDATTGEQPGAAVAPARVLTLALPKTGLRGLDCLLAVADIAIPGELYEGLDLDYVTPFTDGYAVPLVAP